MNNGIDYRPSDRILEYPEVVIDMISVFSGVDRFRDDYNSLIEKSKGGITMCEIYDKILIEAVKQQKQLKSTNDFWSCFFVGL